MAAFAKYYLDFLWSLVSNIGKFFITLGSAFKAAFFTDIGNYFSSLSEAIKDFDVWGYICLIVISIINVALIFFILYRLIQLIRRYFFFRAKEVDKDELLEEVASLKERANQLTKEKSEIFALKLGATSSVATAGANGEVASTVSSSRANTKANTDLVPRFTKLLNIDKKYNTDPHFIFMNTEDRVTLPEIITHFRNFAASQMKLYYNEKIIRKYIAAMATSKIIILEGISGTGKTSLPYAMAKFFDNNAAIVSVQPSWRDRAELVGYFNEFTKKFNETDFLASLYEATYREDPNFIVLDEMNLARIEYYFAEFLSIMEMPDTGEWTIELVAATSKDDPKNLMDGKLLIPQDVWFVGTANQDDSTFTITDKVYDRAVSITINEKGVYFDAPTTSNAIISAEYLLSLFSEAVKTFHISESSLTSLKKMDTFLQDKFKVGFGNRIFKQINIFVPVYMACGGSEVEAVDFMLTSKILRKLSMLNLPFLQTELKELATLIEKSFGENNCPMSSDFIRSLQKLI